MIIDAHFHCWELSRGDYGWLTPELGPIYRDVRIADWFAEAAPVGVQAGVLIQAAPTEAETQFLLLQAEAHSAVLGVVGWVDMLAPGAPGRIRQLARHRLLKGLRPMLHDMDDAQWILQPALQPALTAITECGLVFDALIRPRHLAHMLTLAGRYPGLHIVIDHAGKPDIASRQWQPWADGLARLASRTNAVCKLSGLLTEAGPSPAAGAMRPWARHVLHCFGPSRVLWGSDWPVLERAATYGQWWQESNRLLSGLNMTERDAVLGGNAQRIYML